MGMFEVRFSVPEELKQVSRTLLMWKRRLDLELHFSINAEVPRQRHAHFVTITT